MMAVQIPDYESMVRKFYELLLSPGACCVDVGAHTGRHTLPMARTAGPNGRIHAFEPLPYAADLLRKQLAELAGELQSEVTLRQVGLGSSRGTTAFIAVEEAPEYSGLRPRVYDQPVTTKEIEIEVHTLDDYLDVISHVDYIKIDVEGAELEVLRGGQELVRRDQPLITFEFGDNSIGEYAYSSRDMYCHLAQNEYSVLSILGHELDEAGFVAAANKQQYWDYVACPRSKRDMLQPWLATCK
jgi:FkbM family methyltransferase